MERHGFLFKLSDGSWWRPVGFDGQDKTGEPHLDFSPNGESLIWGKVTAQKITHGCHAESWKEYASLSSARGAARRLVEKLEQAKSEAEFNAVIDAWLFD